MRKQDLLLFDKPGKHNTDACIQAVNIFLRERGAHPVVVASTSGETALAFHKALPENTPLVTVTHSVGFKEPNVDEFDPGIRRILSDAGVKIMTGTILTHSLEKSIMEKSGGSYPGYIIASTLRRFGEGAKVAVEIVMEAADAGYIREDSQVLAVGGTGRGSDTVLLITAKTSKRFLELEVNEFIAKPQKR